MKTVKIGNKEYDMFTRLLCDVWNTRTFGVCYQPVKMPTVVYGKLNGQTVWFQYRTYGKSWQYGGHKSKLHVNYMDNRAPVRSKMLKDIVIDSNG
jgi:hypothetical protein